MKSITRTLFVLATLLAPAFTYAAVSVGIAVSSGNTFISFGWGPLAVGCASYVSCFASTILDVINYVLVPVLFAIAFIVFLYGVAKTYIFSIGNEEEVSKGHKLILWGLIGFAVMVSVWGLVNIVVNTFGLAGYGAPPTPTSYSGQVVP